MSRPLRLEFAGALYHVTSRGDRREDIVESDNDRYLFLSILSDVCEIHNWVCHAYCLMGNHYHLVIETPDANLSKGMRHLNGVYTQAFNRSNDRVGHVFQGRYKAIHVEKDSYLLELARYVVLNPVRAHMVRSAREYRWSSYRAMVGQAEVPVWLTTDWVLAAFGRQQAKAIEGYKQFIAEGKNQPSPWEGLSKQVFLGGDEFLSTMQTRVDEEKLLSDIPRSQRRAKPLPLADYQTSASSRDEAIVNAYACGGYTQKEIGDYFGLHYARVSRIVKKAKVET